MKIKITRIELLRGFLETYTKCGCNVNTSQEIVEQLCKELNIPVSGNYCYISDLLRYLLDTTTIILDITQVDLIMVIINNRYFDYSRTFGNYKFFRDLMSTCVLPKELKNVRIDYLLNKIKESRGE